MKDIIEVTVWNEYRHEKENPAIGKLYPEGIHGAIAQYLRSQPGLKVHTATQDEPEHGLTDEVLKSTDVLVWWSHIAEAQAEISDLVVDKTQRRILDGMGLIVLHSAITSKIFKRLTGTTGTFPRWNEAGIKERLWVVWPGHPIAQGIGEYIEVEHDEMYGEPLDIPPPDELVFISWFQSGEVFRSGCCFSRGKGKIFYFRPGHETFPIYYHQDVLRVIYNAVCWAAPSAGPNIIIGGVPPSKPLEKLPA